MTVTLRQTRLHQCFAGFFLLMTVLILTAGSLQTVCAAVIGSAVLSGISPNTATAGGPGFTMIVTGTNFVHGATVEFGITTLNTRYVSPTKLTAVVRASYFTGPGTVNVTVINPGSASSNGVTFTVVAPAGPATLTSLSPRQVAAGDNGFTLHVIGTNFVNGAIVYFGTTALKTHFVSPTKLTAVVRASYFTAPGTVNVTVINPATTVSNALPITILTTQINLTLGTITRNQTTKVLTVLFTLSNAGHETAPNLNITLARLNKTDTTTTLPLSLGDLTAGGNVNTSIDFPGGAGKPTATETFFVGGTYTGGTFLKEIKVVLPILPPDTEDSDSSDPVD